MSSVRLQCGVLHAKREQRGWAGSALTDREHDFYSTVLHSPTLQSLLVMDATDASIEHPLDVIDYSFLLISIRFI